MSTNKTTEGVRQVMIETARVQFASLNAGIVFWSGWLESASKFAQTLNAALTNLGEEGSDATARFKKDIAAAATQRAARTRAVRVKA